MFGLPAARDKPVHMLTEIDNCLQSFSPAEPLRCGHTSGSIWPSGQPYYERLVFLTAVRTVVKNSNRLGGPPAASVTTPLVYRTYRSNLLRHLELIEHNWFHAAELCIIAARNRSHQARQNTQPSMNNGLARSLSWMCNPETRRADIRGRRLRTKRGFLERGLASISERGQFPFGGEREGQQWILGRFCTWKPCGGKNPSADS